MKMMYLRKKEDLKIIKEVYTSGEKWKKMYKKKKGGERNEKEERTVLTDLTAESSHSPLFTWATG